jgi:hypothetical protein
MITIWPLAALLALAVLIELGLRWRSRRPKWRVPYSKLNEYRRTPDFRNRSKQ